MGLCEHFAQKPILFLSILLVTPFFSFFGKAKKLHG